MFAENPWPRLEFGKSPANFWDAWRRLPPHNHPLIKTDKAMSDGNMEQLSLLRDILQTTLEANWRLNEYTYDGTFAPESLEERLVLLTPEQMNSYKESPFWNTLMYLS